MDWQPYINMAIGTAFGIAGWFANQLWSAVQELKRDLKALEVKLPSEYVKKDDLGIILDRIYQILDRIERKLDDKVDK
jgi:cobalamin biosynthesis Co2+ chelatase CbiK